MPSVFFACTSNTASFHVLLIGLGGAGALPWRYEPSCKLMERADLSMQPEKHTPFSMTHAFSISVPMHEAGVEERWRYWIIGHSDFTMYRLLARHHQSRNSVVLNVHNPDTSV